MGETTAVIFDLDDTLYPERRFALSGYAAVASRLADETGMPADVLYRFMVRRFRRHGREGLLQALCASYAISTSEIPRFVDVIRSHSPRLTLPNESRDVLRHLRGRGHRVGILTNGLPITQRAKVAVLGIEPLVDTVVYAQEHAPDGKPAAVCFTAALQRLGATASKAVFVGDHPEKDIAGAAGVGMRSIWLTRRRPAALGAHASAIAHTLTEVPDLVARLLEARHVASC